jgi:hypothetical protein
MGWYSDMIVGCGRVTARVVVLEVFDVLGMEVGGGVMRR